MPVPATVAAQSISVVVQPNPGADARSQAQVHGCFLTGDIDKGWGTASPDA